MKKFKNQNELDDEISAWLAETSCDIHTAVFQTTTEAMERVVELENGNENLEGFVLKNGKSIVTPNKKHKTDKQVNLDDHSFGLLDFEP